VLLGADARDVRRRRAHLGWMLALAVVMFVEKVVAWGRTMTVVVGVGLAGWGSGLLLGIPGLPRPL
jgi:hypothetical protein